MAEKDKRIHIKTVLKMGTEFSFCVLCALLLMVGMSAHMGLFAGSLMFRKKSCRDQGDGSCVVLDMMTLRL
jgi:hypothetical protein